MSDLAAVVLAIGLVGSAGIVALTIWLVVRAIGDRAAAPESRGSAEGPPAFNTATTTPEAMRETWASILEQRGRHEQARQVRERGYVTSPESHDAAAEGREP